MIQPSSDGRGQEPWFGFFTKTLSRSAIFLFSFITLITVSCSSYDFLLLRQESSLSLAQQIRNNENINLLLVLVGLQKQIEIDFIRVQQLLTEYSATRGLDGHEDGLEAAAKFAEQLGQDIVTAKTTAKAYESPALMDAFSKIEQSFPEYYQRGFGMAKVYAAEGPAAGNRLMRRLDTIRDEIQQQLAVANTALAAAQQTHAVAADAGQIQIDDLHKRQSLIGFGSIILMALTCLLAIFTVRKWVVEPLQQLSNCMLHLTSGRNEIDIPSSGRTDEIGLMTGALQKFKDAAIEKRRMQAEAAKSGQRLAEAQAAMEQEKEDYTLRKTESQRQMVDLLEREGKAAVGAVIGLMQKMTHISREMSGAAERLTLNSGSVAAAAKEAMGTMQSARSATEDLSASLDDVVNQVNRTNIAASNAVAASEMTAQKIQALHHAVAEIGGITTLITDIARMTSLLAINAGVEAARAGTMGLGFAVIAKEVKSLSEQTSNATNRIVNLISQVEQSTSGAVDAVAEISTIIQTVNQVSVTMAESIKQQVHSTRLIAANVTETTVAVAKVTTRIEEVAVEADSAGQRAKQVEDVCSDVSENVHELEGSFVRIVRTSSEDTNRRISPRHEVKCQGRIEIDGKVTNVEIIDLSIGGAKLKGVLPPGLHAFTLRLQGSDLVLPGKIIAASHEFTHLQFFLTAEVTSRLAEYLETRGSEQSAAAA